MARVTLQTIADRVGVSRMTVSNAYSRPDQLSVELRAQILAAAAELGYPGPSPAGRGLAIGRAGTVGVVLSESLAWAFNDEVASRFVGAVATELGPSGAALTVLTSSVEGDFIPARDVALDGALLYLCEDDAPALGWLVQRRLPLVFVDHTPTDDFDTVNVDDRTGARLGAQHLIDLGHRSVGIIAGGGNSPTRLTLDERDVPDPTSSARLDGWHDVLSDAQVTPVVVQANLFDPEGGAAALDLILATDPTVTALLCFSDVLAVSAVRAAQRRGLDVPGDLSVVGFDGTRLGANLTPSLTTIRQDVDEKGRAAAHAIMRRIEDPARPVQHTKVSVELVLGASTAEPASV